MHLRLPQGLSFWFPFKAVLGAIFVLKKLPFGKDRAPISLHVLKDRNPLKRPFKTDRNPLKKAFF